MTMREGDEDDDDSDSKGDNDNDHDNDPESTNIQIDNRSPASALHQVSLPRASGPPRPSGRANSLP
ncbi:hypothetical protein M433DRAFT_153582 [Acidomyces richmondensis BFW]|nr:MAG: hypothetical protein FE78DRAFT_89255 [Acidomyces sp. 'richmondensis']KYG46277.1 hypothetical protein M433DRAFT_153582 [Acidomyces richmondensis BFW]